MIVPLIDALQDPDFKLQASSFKLGSSYSHLKLNVEAWSLRLELWSLIIHWRSSNVNDQPLRFHINWTCICSLQTWRTPAVPANVRWRRVSGTAQSMSGHPSANYPHSFLKFMAMVGIMGCKACTTSGGVTVELGALLIFCKSTALCTCLECCVVL